VTTLEKASHVAALTTSALLCVAIALSFLRPPLGSFNSSHLLGTHIEIPGIEWSQKTRTVLLALSAGCHYCSESTPFYRRLTEHLSNGKSSRIIAILPDDDPTARAFFQDARLDIVYLPNIQFPIFGIEATPTVLIVDSGGVVRKEWTGKLSPWVQEEVISAANSTSFVERIIQWVQSN